MNAVAVLGAERIKLSTTRAPLWCAVTAAVLSVGLAALQAATATYFSPMTPEKAAIGPAVLGVPVLMILAAMAVTGEYRSQTICTTFMATPRRTVVLTAKAVVTGCFSGVYAALTVIGAMAVAQLITPPAAASLLTLSDSWRPVVTVGVYAALAAVLAVGVGALVRHAAGAVAVLLLWPLLVEPVLANLPSVGTEAGPYLPFRNAFVFTDVTWLYPPLSAPWGSTGSLAYFIAVVTAVFVVALIVLNRRDA